MGILAIANENVNHILLVAAKEIGIELEDRDIDWVSRVGPRSPPAPVTMPRPVVVRFLRRSKRDGFLRATKSRRILSSADLGVCGIQTKSFL